MTSDSTQQLTADQPPQVRAADWNETESMPGRCRWCNQAAQVRDCYCGLFVCRMVKGICKPCYHMIDAMLTPSVVRLPITLEVVA